MRLNIINYSQSILESQKLSLKFIILLFIINNSQFTAHSFSQGVSINTSGLTADASAMLDISSTSKGLLIPRMTLSQRDNINSPATSLLIFNTTTNCFDSYVNGTWFSLSCPPPCTMPASTTPGINTSSQTQIIWNWNTVNGATGYQWNTSSAYPGNGINVVAFTSYTQTGLICNTSYSFFIWAYNNCGNSASVNLTQNTSTCGPSCGTQVWMLKNLDNPTNEICYNYTPSNCAIYGGLYAWNDAMTGASSVNCDPCGPSTGHGGVQGLCPAGYHIPSDPEFSRYEYCIDALQAPADLNSSTNTLSYFQNTAGWRGSTISGVGPGDKMKVTSSNIPSWDGTNTSGFGAMPGGYNGGGIWELQGSVDVYWTATISPIPVYPWIHWLSSGYTQIWRNTGSPKNYQQSIRCLKD
jgi:uncharacterized protein (TIGR02145 family)